MAVARDDLGRAARKRGIEGQVTIIRHFGIRCIETVIDIRKIIKNESKPDKNAFSAWFDSLSGSHVSLSRNFYILEHFDFRLGIVPR